MRNLPFDFFEGVASFSLSTTPFTGVCGTDTDVAEGSEETEGFGRRGDDTGAVAFPTWGQCSASASELVFKL